MTALGLVFFLWPVPLVRVFSPDPRIIEISVSLLAIAAGFQLFDGTQAVVTGALRGISETRMPMIVNVIGFWCIGMPVSLWLGFGLDYGAVGLWWGLVVGLIIVAAFLIARVRQREKHGLERIIIDEHAKDALRTEPGVD